MSLSALQDASGLPPSVLESVLDYLSTQQMVEEIEKGKYTGTKLTQLMLVPLFQDAVTHL